MSATSGSSGRRSVIAGKRPTSGRQSSPPTPARASAPARWDLKLCGRQLHQAVAPIRARRDDRPVAPFARRHGLDAAPLPSVVARLNDLEPAVLRAYASKIWNLADQQLP